MKKSEKRIGKELDLIKFIQRMRSITSGTLGLLTPQQRLFVDEFSQILIYESSCNSSGSDDCQDEAFDNSKN